MAHGMRWDLWSANWMPGLENSCGVPLTGPAGSMSRCACLAGRWSVVGGRAIPASDLAWKMVFLSGR